MTNSIEEQSIKQTENNRIDFITWLQFVGVIAVIFGHSMNDINVIPVLKDIKAWIYTFHMPLFFFVSAFLFALKGGYDRGYKRVIFNRFTRLLIPYFIWNLLFIIPKIIMSQYINEQVVLNPDYFLQINLSPRDNIRGHTWFLFALFEMFLLAIVLDKWRRNKILWLPLVSIFIVLNCFGIQSRFLAISDIMKNCIFFWLGLLLGNCKLETIALWLKEKLLFWALIFNVIAMSVVWFFFKEMYINTLMLGISIIALLCLFQDRFCINNKIINFISNNSFAIYILHWPLMCCVRLIVLNKLHLEAFICMLAMLLGGICLPVLIILLIKKSNHKLVNFLSKFLLGLRE